MLTLREAINKLLSVTHIDEGSVNDSGYMITAIKGGVGYEYPLDAWFSVKKGHRWNVAYIYTSNVGAGGSITSSSWVVQDNSVNNYLYFRMFVHNEGSTNMTYKIQQSYNNSTWYDVPDQSITLTSNGNGVLEGKIYMPYMRVVMTNNDSTNGQTSNLVYIVLF